MNNVFAFHGIDHKVGVTMIAQSVAELIAANDKKREVMLISLSGRQNCEYIREEVKSIDDFKLQLDSRMIVSKDLRRDCRYKENMYILSGISNEQEERYYFPDKAKYLLEIISEEFDIVVVDTGSDLDNGLAFGGLEAADSNYLVLTQMESNLKRMEKAKKLFEQTGVEFKALIINKFYENDPHTLSFISERLGVDKECLIKVEGAGYDRQAEMERKTLMEFKSDGFTTDIRNIANLLLDNMGIPNITNEKRGKIWRNFI